MMRTKTAAAGAVALLLSALGAAASTGASAGGEVVTLKFQSLAFQDSTIAAVQGIVDSWNEANPNIQVELTQGSWDNVHDQLVTQFAGGTAPDIIHDEAADIMGFAEDGYIADLGPLLSDEIKASISDDIWATVTASDGSLAAAPTLLQSYVVFANVDAFEAAGVEIPTGETLAWDDFQQLARDLTGDDSYGLGWGLRSPTATIMNLALGFDGGFFETDGDVTTIEVGDAEMEVPLRIHSMAYEDASLDPLSLTLSGGDTLQGFFGGDYAMYAGGSFNAQSMSTAAPEGFNWVVLPPLAGTAGPYQAANPQTMSVSIDSAHQAEAAQFIEYFISGENLAALALGDWLIPASADARAVVLEQTGGDNGWDQVIASGESLIAAPFQQAAGYVEWRNNYATPGFQAFLTNGIDAETLQQQLTDGWAQVGG